jgi:hypothetical protein
MTKPVFGSGKNADSLHVAATCWLTLYLAHPKRGQQAIDAMGILPSFQGISVHDSLICYLKYACVHALCNAHYLRELTFIDLPVWTTVGQRNENLTARNQRACGTGTRTGNDELA